jgi:hypothetical protein
MSSRRKCSSHFSTGSVYSARIECSANGLPADRTFANAVERGPGVRTGGHVARGDDSRRVDRVGYVLQGVIGSAASVQPGRGLVNAVVPLGQGPCLLPMTESLFDEVTRGRAVDSRFAQCQRFPPGFDTVLAEWSRQGPVAYVEADFWRERDAVRGGMGGWRACAGATHGR